MGEVGVVELVRSTTMGGTDLWRWLPGFALALGLLAVTRRWAYAISKMFEEQLEKQK